MTYSLTAHSPWEGYGGGHGGGDGLPLVDVFRGAGQDPLRRRAGYEDGLHSVAVGVAINESLRTGRLVHTHGTETGRRPRRGTLPAQ
ncbi:hypothetical protein [Streptomyces sp. NPDC059894]|uniref:hypothetical protein n=1 Tax=unclassified Streptomyces TaxID=2593676 RepID=UPI00364E353A